MPFQVEQTPHSPVQLLREVVALMKVRADAKGLQLNVVHRGPLPESIRSDPTRLRQILINLIGNAVKFTEVGSVRVVVEMVDSRGEHPKLQFQVTDTGIGMTAAQTARVFEPFAQADTSTTRQYGGSGLGLTISKRLIERLGGHITIDSQPDRGSTFTFTVATGPLDSVRMIDSAIDTDSRARKTSAVASPPKPTLDCRILLAEDGPDNQRLISFILKAAGADVVVAENGQVAIDCLHEAATAGNPFELVLMDMQMPVLDGYHATRNLRAEGYEGPIVALTAHAMTSDRQKCIDAGCDDYLTKPIDRNELIELVATYTPQPNAVKDS